MVDQRRKAEGGAEEYKMGFLKSSLTFPFGSLKLTERTYNGRKQQQNGKYKQR